MRQKKPSRDVLAKTPVTQASSGNEELKLQVAESYVREPKTKPNFPLNPKPQSTSHLPPRGLQSQWTSQGIAGEEAVEAACTQSSHDLPALLGVGFIYSLGV